MGYVGEMRTNPTRRGGGRVFTTKQAAVVDDDFTLVAYCHNLRGSAHRPQIRLVSVLVRLTHLPAV